MFRLLLGLCAFCVAALPARADEYTFQVRSLHPNAVQIKFYSQTRKGHEWPSTSTAWDLLDDEVHAIGMTCRRNEKICWGAWVRGSGRPEWGMGNGGKKGCSACCFVCTNARSPGTITLKIRVDGDRVVPIQTFDTAKPARPPKSVILD